MQYNYAVSSTLLHSIIWNSEYNISVHTCSFVKPEMIAKKNQN